MKAAAKFLGLIVFLLLMSFKLIDYKKVVVIDVGHGGKDFGFINGGAYEKEIVGNISKKIMAFHKKKELEIIFIGDRDSTTSIEARISEISQIKPDLVISLHLSNSKDKEARGVQAFVSEKNVNYEKSREHAEKLIHVVAKKDLRLGEVKPANLLLLEKSPSPAISLEVGFLSNETDRNYLMSEKGQEKIAKRILTYLNQ